MSLHSLVLQQLCPAVKEHFRRSTIWSLHDHQNDAFEWECALEEKEYESGTESLNIPTPLHRTPCLYHISASENLSFDPATLLTHWAHSPQWHRSLSSVHHCLTFSNDKNPSPDSSPLHGRPEQSSPTEQQMVHHHTADSLQDVTNEEEEEYFPTAPLDDDVWLEEPVPDRHLCLHEQSQPHDLCPYSCPYSWDELHPTPGNAPTPHYEMMDLSDIFNFPDVMTTASDEDIPDLDNVLDLEYGLNKLLYSSNFLHMKQDEYIYEHW